VVGIGLGSGLSYILDPNRGHRRRAMFRDQWVHFRHESQRQLDLGFRDIGHRAQGVFARTRALIRNKRPVDDSVLHGRVRSKLGRYVSHPHAIEVQVQDGKVTLRGLILNTEVGKTVRAISHVPGVKKVVNELEPHARNESIPALQGGRERTGEHLDLFQSNWAPSTRLLLGFAGGVLSIYGVQQRNRIGLFNGLFGFLLALRGVTNRDFSDLWSIGSLEDFGENFGENPIQNTPDRDWKEAV